jgi:hypothetical protein
MWSEEEAQAAYFSMMKTSHYLMVGDGARHIATSIKLKYIL